MPAKQSGANRGSNEYWRKGPELTPCAMYKIPRMVPAGRILVACSLQSARSSLRNDSATSYSLQLLHLEGPPPLRLPESVLCPPAETVNDQLAGAGESSTGVDQSALWLASTDVSVSRTAPLVQLHTLPLIRHRAAEM